jgi:AcrR family transcriptional regulator
MAAPRPTLRDRRRAELRERITATALRLFAERGFDQVTVDEIAAETGISLSTLFRHVPAKDDLLVAVVRTGRAMIVASFGQRPVDEPVREALAHAILHRTEQFTGAAETIELWRRAMASAPPRVRRAALLDEAERAQLIGLVADRLEGGEPGPDDLAAGVLVQVMLAAAEYAYEHWLAGRSALTLHELTGRALDLAAGGSRP